MNKLNFNKDTQKQLLISLDLLKFFYKLNKTEITHQLKNKYDFETIYYYDKKSHLYLNNSSSSLIVSKLFSKFSIVDLQFFIAIRKSTLNSKKEVFIVFKGSQEFADWFTNFNFKLSHHKKFSSSVHSGFYESMNMFRRTIKSDKNLNKKLNFEKDIELINKNYNINIIGHSLGGAVATLAACYLHDKGIQKENLNTFTFGSPVIAKKDFCEFYKDKFLFLRFVANTDPIPKVPFNDLSHFGTEYKLNIKKLYAHSLESYARCIKSNF